MLIPITIPLFQEQHKVGIVNFAGHTGLAKKKKMLPRKITCSGIWTSNLWCINTIHYCAAIETLIEDFHKTCVIMP